MRTDHSPLVREGRKLFCFRAPGTDEQAGDDDNMACALPPGHEGDCIFGNGPMLAKAIGQAKERGYEKLEVEHASDGSGIYVTRRETGMIARSVQADEAVTLDYDLEDRLIGIEILARPRSS